MSLESLENALTLNRGLLEELSSDPGFDITMFYDEYPFRCSRVLCFYFHKGLKVPMSVIIMSIVMTSRSRDQLTTAHSMFPGFGRRARFALI